MAASVGAETYCRDWRGKYRSRPHLPVYKRLGFPVASIFDVNLDASRGRATAFASARVFESLAEAASTRDVIFNVAIPPESIAGVLEQLPVGAKELIQKPRGRNLADASVRSRRSALHSEVVCVISYGPSDTIAAVDPYCIHELSIANRQD